MEFSLLLNVRQNQLSNPVFDVLVLLSTESGIRACLGWHVEREFLPIVVNQLLEDSEVF